MPDDLLRTRLERLDAQWREDASQMHAGDRAVQARTLTMADAMAAVLEDAEPVSPGPGVVTRRATRLALVNAIRGQQVMVSLTGPPADLEAAAWLADVILERLPEAAPAPEGRYVTRDQLARAIRLAGVASAENSAADAILRFLPEAEPASRNSAEWVTVSREDLRAVLICWDREFASRAENEAHVRLAAAAGEATAP